MEPDVRVAISLSCRYSIALDGKEVVSSQLLDVGGIYTVLLNNAVGFKGKVGIACLGFKTLNFFFFLSPPGVGPEGADVGEAKRHPPHVVAAPVHCYHDGGGHVLRHRPGVCLYAGMPLRACGVYLGIVPLCSKIGSPFPRSYFQAPVTMKSVLTSAWLLTVAFGNLIVVLITEIRFFSSQVRTWFIITKLLSATVA